MVNLISLFLFSHRIHTYLILLHVCSAPRWAYFIGHSFQVDDKIIKKLLLRIRIDTLAIQYLDGFLLVLL